VDGALREREETKRENNEEIGGRKTTTGNSNIASGRDVVNSQSC